MGPCKKQGEQGVLGDFVVHLGEGSSLFWRPNQNTYKTFVLKQPKNNTFLNFHLAETM